MEQIAHIKFLHFFVVEKSQAYKDCNEKISEYYKLVENEHQFKK